MFEWLSELFQRPLKGEALRRYMQSIETVETTTLLDGRVIEYRVYDEEKKREQERARK